MSTSHATSAPDACSMLWETSALPAAGTASRAAFWVGLEQPGPWGREASMTSHLDPHLGGELAQACESAGGRLLLLRAPGDHPDHAAGASRRVLIAGGLATDPWLLEGEIDDPDKLMALPWSAVTGADPDQVTARFPLLEETRDAALLVCTNGKRDVCCAVRGRPVALAAAQARPGRVWECSHTGGHRFAPTALTLPSGQMWARLNEDLAVAALDAEDSRTICEALNSTVHNRGRSVLAPAAQAAEVWWREQEGELRLGGVSCAAEALEGDGYRVTVRHDDGRQALVLVLPEDHADLRESCRKPLGTNRAWRVTPATGR